VWIRGATGIEKGMKAAAATAAAVLFVGSRHALGKGAWPRLQQQEQQLTLHWEAVAVHHSSS